MRRLGVLTESLFRATVTLADRYPKLGSILRPLYHCRATRLGISWVRSATRLLDRCPGPGAVLSSIHRSESARLSIAWIRLLLADPGQIRFFIPWLSSLRRATNALDDGAPWVTFGARKWLESFLAPDMHVFEFSSGGSTIFMARRANTLVSVEHDENWYKVTKEALTKHHIQNCQYLFVTPQQASEATHEPNDPYGFISSLYPGMSFERYVSSVSAFPNESFDLVSVDGRARPSCILHALAKVRTGGYLMLDNSERGWYQRGKDLLIDWEKTHFFGPGPYLKGFWQTSIYKKRSKPPGREGLTHKGSVIG